MNDTPNVPAARERKPVRLWDLALPLLATLIPLGVVGIVGVLAVLSGSISGDDFEQFIAKAAYDFTTAQLFMAAIYIAMFAALWQIAKARGPSTLSGYFSPVRQSTLVASILCGLVLAGTVMVIIGWLDQQKIVAFHTTPKEEMLLAARGPWQLILSLVVIAVVAPLTEEFYFRGFLLAWLRRRFWLPLAAIADAALFALVHGRFIDHPGIEGWILTLMVGLVGLVNVIWYVRTRSLWPAFLTHMFYNATLVTLAYLGS